MYLAHHGIKGMRWGIRRYQNPDGTLTDAGRKRYASVLKKEAPAEPGAGQVPDLLLTNDEKYIKDVEKTGIIPKGSYAYRVTTKNENPSDNHRKYVSLTKSGAYDYENSYIEGNLGSFLDSEDIRVRKYETIKNLKVATSKEVDDFIASTRPDTIRYKTIRDDLESLRLVGDPYTTDTYRKKKLSKKAKEAQQYMMSAQSYLNKARNRAMFSTKYNKENPVFKHFADLGYDAISDVEDGGLGNDMAWAPAIILNPTKTLKLIDDNYDI